MHEGILIPQMFGDVHGSRMIRMDRLRLELPDRRSLPESGSKLRALHTLRESWQLRCSRQRLECRKLASALTHRMPDNARDSPLPVDKFFSFAKAFVEFRTQPGPRK